MQVQKNLFMTLHITIAWNYKVFSSISRLVTFRAIAITSRLRSPGAWPSSAAWGR